MTGPTRSRQRNRLACLTTLLSLGGLILSTGCSTTPPPPSAAPADATNAVWSIDRILVGQNLTIMFADIPNPPDPVVQRVREDGTISLMLGVQVEAAGKKPGELQDLIHDAYVPKYFQRLTVTVRTEERVFYVRGAVRRPDRYVYAGEMTVLKAISVAGDFNEFAMRKKVEIIRSDGTKVKVDCKKALNNPKYDVPVYPGDTVTVPQKIWF